MATPVPSLIWCADGNYDHSLAALSAGWLYGVRLPHRGILPDTPLHFADQDWKRPDRIRYMEALRQYRPALATVIDWEEESQLHEVLSWAEEASEHVAEAVLIIPKVPDRIGDIPESIGGKEVRIAYSVPTSYGGSPLGLWELKNRTIHLLGGSPQKQHEIWMYLRGVSDVKSMDGNMAKKMATSRCLYWDRTRSPTGHWRPLDGFDGNGPTECVRRSSLNIKAAWSYWANTPEGITR